MCAFVVSKTEQIQLRKIESLNRSIKDCRADATVFNCIVSVFSKSTIYAQLQNLKDTQYFKNSEGEMVKKLQPDELLPSFDDVLSQEKKKEEEKLRLEREEAEKALRAEPVPTTDAELFVLLTSHTV